MSSTNKPLITKKADFPEKETYWLKYAGTTGKNYTIDPIQFDFNKAKIADALLAEFIHTSEEDKLKIRPLILNWLDENDLRLNDNENFYQLRDLIYEMF